MRRAAAVSARRASTTRGARLLGLLLLGVGSACVDATIVVDDPPVEDAGEAPTPDAKVEGGTARDGGADERDPRPERQRCRECEIVDLRACLTLPGCVECGCCDDEHDCGPRYDCYFPPPDRRSAFGRCVPR